MNWPKVGRIIRREYLESVRKKSFLFGLVATPLMMLVLIALPFFSEEMISEGTVTLAVVDHTREYGRRLEQDLLGETAPDAARLRVTVFTPPDLPASGELNAWVADGSLTGWVLLPADFEQTATFEFHSESVTNLAALESLEARFERMLARRRAEEFGMSAERVDELLSGVEMRTFRIGKNGGEEADFAQVYFHAVALVMILFFALMPTGQILMRSVIEEKSNRVIEVLLSSVTPQELMVGKIIGLGAVGLTLVGVWTAIGLVITSRLGGDFPIGGDDLAVFLLYFFPGYFFYAALLGSVGSICNAEREAQPFLTPISLMLVLPVMVGFAIAQSPDHLIARICSFVPFFTPSLMLFRFTIKEPPAWEIAATWLTLLLSTAGMFWVSSRVFRIGILLTGKRPTIPEVARWVRAR